MSKNYIEVVHEYVETDENGDWEKARDVQWAVNPTGDSYIWGKKGEEPGDFDHAERGGWQIRGKLYVYSIEDINGLRKLLDALEAEF